MEENNEIAYLDTQEGVDMVLSQLQDINQPVNTQLSSLLQLVCLLSHDVTLVDYLLEKGANPNYLDYRGWSAFDYAYFNKALFAPQLICLSLERYQDKFPKEDATERRRQILDWALKTIHESDTKMGN